MVLLNVVVVMPHCGLPDSRMLQARKKAPRSRTEPHHDGGPQWASMALLDVPAQAVALATFVISPEGVMKPAVFGSITVREGAPPRKPGQLAWS